MRTGMLVGWAIALLSLLGYGGSTAIRPRVIERSARPNEGIMQSTRNWLITWLILGPILGLLIGGLGHLDPVFRKMVGPDLPGGMWAWFGLGISSGALIGLMYGGLAVLQHWIFRGMLWQAGVLPLRLVAFLDFWTDRSLLRRIGGGYIFFHRLLMVHIATMPDHDIVQVAERVTQEPSASN